MVSRLESQGAKVCKSCRSRQELSNEYLVFTRKNRRRYSREWAAQSLPKGSNKVNQSKIAPAVARGGTSAAGAGARERQRRWVCPLLPPHMLAAVVIAALAAAEAAAAAGKAEAERSRGSIMERSGMGCSS